MEFAQMYPCIKALKITPVRVKNSSWESRDAKIVASWAIRAKIRSYQLTVTVSVVAESDSAAD